MINLNQLKELSDLSPAGPWEEYLGTVTQVGSDMVVADVLIENYPQRQSTAQFICLCVEYVRQELQKNGNTPPIYERSEHQG